MKLKNEIEFKVWGRYALFTDPLTKMGGEKCSYHIPTYEALKGIVKSIYWKPSLIWYIDKVRIMNKIQTQTKGIKTLKMNNEKNDLFIYSYLSNVEYQVKAHYDWNYHSLKQDKNENKHNSIIKRSLEHGGRQDIFLGTRDCQGYVEPCTFGSEKGAYDEDQEIAYGIMFHGFDYPDETGKNELWCRLWNPKMVKGIIDFISPDKCTIRKFIRNMTPKKFEKKQEGIIV